MNWSIQFIPDKILNNPYDAKYGKEPYYWGIQPSRLCVRIIEHKPPDRPFSVLDIGCGEGRNAVFLAAKGYDVSAFDQSVRGIDKARNLSDEHGLKVNFFIDDVNTHRLNQNIDILLCANSLFSVPRSRHRKILEYYKENTNNDGLHALAVIVEKPFIERPSHENAPAFPWFSGEVLTYYHDWKIEFFREKILESHDGGVRHQHAVNALLARKPFL